MVIFLRKEKKSSLNEVPDNTFLPPPEKPRKLKGTGEDKLFEVLRCSAPDSAFLSHELALASGKPSFGTFSLYKITYRKPGPPTPSINAARHSLPGNEKLELKRGLREHNSNTGQARSRLSQLFGSISISKVKNVQESPKVKRRSFFQRTFGNRENIPPK